MTTKEVTVTYGNGTSVNKVRMIADETKVLTKDGKTFWNCYEDFSTDGWYETDPPLEEGEHEATVEDYEAAMKEVGVV